VTSILDIGEFQSLTSVSRETLARLSAYEQLLRKWQKAINLVGPSTLHDPWRRHFLDSAQLLDLIPPARPPGLIDLGSGAGFPGLVLAILGLPDVHLVEVDARKCAFLREVARITDTPVTIHPWRIADLPEQVFGIVTARALAPLDKLLDLAMPVAAPGARLLFHKGRTVDRELTTARKRWKLSMTRVASRSDAEGVILTIEVPEHG
jgi:16S rRNA (guanine527-N7)-methyltransferase